MRYKKDSLDDNINELLPQELEVLMNSLKANISKQEGMLEATIKSIQHAKLNNFKPTDQIWNLAGFIMIVSMDLKTTMYSLLASDNEWMKRFYLRQSCLITYESIDDIFQLLGKNFKNMIADKFSETSLDQEFNSVRKRLNEFKKIYQNKIKKVRNVSIAHKDHNIENQIEQIINLSFNENLVMLIEFDNILNELGGKIQKTINKDLERLYKSK
ncbi:hypothetical protein CEQ90_19935 [Lewinellaceae bacterium SD302]|nr:hypothetical protein CEQ90_19935 [Lewinellaceae bacterium SD302]